MNRWILTACLTGLALATGGCAPTTNGAVASASEAAPADVWQRQRIMLRDGWQFRFGAPAEGPEALAYDASSWAAVSVPHTWNRIGEYSLTRSEATNNDQGVGWYRLQLDAPEAPALWRQYLDFAAVGNIADVWVNGHHVGQHRGAFSRFRFDVTEHWLPGESNIIAVRADNSRPAPDSSTADVIPLAGDFFVNGGIYREASLLQLPPASIDPLDMGGPGLYARASEIGEDAASVEARVVLRNFGSGRQLSLSTSVTDGEGHLVAQAEQAVDLPQGRSEAVGQLTIANPQLWNGRADPALYTISTSLTDEDGRVIDTVTQPLGIRSFRYDADAGFFLNGEYVKLHGVSRHQDWQGSGWALSPEQHRRDMEIIAELGANTVRHAHYQHDDFWSDLADEYGMIVWAELAYVGMPSFGGDPGSTELWANAEQQLRELIRQNYNHPSITMWSIGNEVDSGMAFGVTQENPQPLPLLQRLREIANEEDPHRPTIFADFSEQQGEFGERRQALEQATQLIGYNRYPGWYYLQNPMAGRALGGIMDRLHATHPETPVSISEYGAGGATTQHSDDPVSGFVSSAGRPQPEEYQALVHELLWPAIESRDYIFASWVWNMYDFPSDLRNEGDSVDINTKGLVTFDRETRKDAFYFYQAAWTDAPMIHLAGQRYVERSYPQMDVKAYTNTGSASLFVNGHEIGEVACPNYTCTWAGVQLVPGENRVVVTATAGDAELTDSATFDGIDPLVDGMHIDAGSLAVSQLDGRRYGSDTFVSGGTPVPRFAGSIGSRNAGPPREIASSAPALFEHWREGEQFAYRIPVPAGEWDVTFRLFDPADEDQPEQALTLRANGVEVIAGLGVAEAAGGRNRELVRPFPVTVADEGLALEFDSANGVVGLAAIEITPR